MLQYPINDWPSAHLSRLRAWGCRGFPDYTIVAALCEYRKMNRPRLCSPQFLIKLIIPVIITMRGLKVRSNLGCEPSKINRVVQDKFSASRITIACLRTTSVSSN